MPFEAGLSHRIGPPVPLPYPYPYPYPYFRIVQLWQELMQAQPAVVQRSKADTMHRRMGHLGYQNLEKLVSMAEGLGVNEKEV